MYSISIVKIEKRRSGKDRRKSIHARRVPERRIYNERRTIDDRRNAVGRRLGVYGILSGQQKERLGKIINVRDAEISDLVIG